MLLLPQIMLESHNISYHNLCIHHGTIFILVEIEYIYMYYILYIIYIYNCKIYIFTGK